MELDLYFNHREQLRQSHREERREREKRRAARHEAEIKCQRSHERNPQKTTFLTLPRELRQQILLDSFDATEPLPKLSEANLAERFRDVIYWANTLTITDTCLRDDVRYVLHQWKKEVIAWHMSEMQRHQETLARLEKMSREMKALPFCPQGFL